MAAAVLSSQSAFRAEIMDPSNVSQNERTRHGRGKHGGSVGKGGRARAVSNVDERENVICKALSWILKRAPQNEELELDEEGFADCGELIQWHHLETNNVTFPEIQAIIANDTQARFTLKPRDSDVEADSTDADDWLISLTKAIVAPKAEISTASLKAITTEDEPEFIIYNTTYASYPSILAAGGIKNLSGSQIHFTTKVSVSDDSEVLIYIDVHKVLTEEPSMSWLRADGKAAVITTGNASGVVEKKFWKKVVGRKLDVGLLWENGEEVKEMPASLRDRKSTGKKVGKGRRGGEKSDGSVVKEALSSDDDEETVA